MSDMKELIAEIKKLSDSAIYASGWKDAIKIIEANQEAIEAQMRDDAIKDLLCFRCLHWCANNPPEEPCTGTSGIDCKAFEQIGMRGPMRFKIIRVIDEWYKCELIPIVDNGGHKYYEGSESTKDEVIAEATLFAESQRMDVEFEEDSDDKNE